MKNTNSDIYFIPLGGGQSVGNSCYYLRLGNENIILDAGMKTSKNLSIAPRTNILLESGFMKSLNEINSIFISHAHLDHIGFLPLLSEELPNTNIYMTEITNYFSNLQLLERPVSKTVRNSILKEKASISLSKAINVSFMQKLDKCSYRVTFYPAGHIPGAMMMLFEYGKRKILYTGDYSLCSTPLTRGCFLPDDLNIDTLIICGLHAKNPNYEKNNSSLNKIIKKINNSVVGSGKNVFCHITQLTKGIELLKAINILNEKSVFKFDIYIDHSIFEAVETLEKAGIPILTKYNHLISEKTKIEPCVIIASNECFYKNRFEYINADFSLHEDFKDMENFIHKINPQYAYIVHCGEDKIPKSETIEQRLISYPNCKTQAIFAEDQEIYKL